MSHATVTDLHPTAEPRDKLHLFVLNHDGTLRASNSPFQQLGPLCLPTVVRQAYGVTPHPDMPEGIYARMEGRLKMHPGSAGYYMCQTAVGEVFWIAVSFYCTPTARVVCHFPVTAPRLEFIETLFAHLKQHEQEGLTPDESAERLVNLPLPEEVADYRSMSISIMIEEIGKRDAGRNRIQYQDLLVLQDILEKLRKIDTLGKSVDAISKHSKLIPHQLKLQAARLEGGRGPLSVVADNHQELTNTLLKVTTELQRASSTELSAVIDAIAYVAQSNHAAELLETGCVTLGDHSDDEENTRKELRLVIEDCSLQIKGLLVDINNAILLLNTICYRMRRAVTAMQLTKMMCKIERAKLVDEEAGLGDIENQLYLVQRNLTDWMSEIDANASNALALAQRLKRGTASGATSQERKALRLSG
jgi:aerotaxis receptor